METYVVDEFQRWGDRGYHQKITCPKHSYLDVIVYVDIEGLCCICPACEHRIDISGGEYKRIQRMIETAKRIFEQE